MYYLIDTPHHPRPYLSTISFIANDFANWGCRITRYASSTPYIAEIRYQEKRIRPAHRRIELMEIWAKEVLSRKQQQTAPASIDAPTTDARKERASAFVQDFITSLSVFESPIVAPAPLQNDPLPLPAYPTALVAKYTRLLCRCAYNTSAPLPSWAAPGVLVADHVVLDFRFEKSVKREQLVCALNEAIGRGSGRMGRVERCDETGATRVAMWVDVGDLEAREMDLLCGKVEVEDPVPVYESAGWEWPPGYEVSGGCDCGGQG